MRNLMKSCAAVALLWLLSSVAAFAQTPVATPASKWGWTMTVSPVVSPTADLATVQGYIYREYDDGAATGRTLASVVCVAAVAPAYSCQAPVLSFTNGSHTVALSAGLSGTGGLEGPKSGALTFTFSNQSIPVAPTTPIIIGRLDLFPFDTTLALNDVNYQLTDTMTVASAVDRTIAGDMAMKFVLPEWAPNAVVSSATLVMSLIGSDTLGGSYRVSTHRILRDWIVGAATGFTIDGANAWTLPLALGDISESFGFKAITTGKNQKTWDLTEIVQGWVANPSSNFGLLLNGDTRLAMAGHFRTFASVDHVDPLLWPYLRIVLGV